MCALLSAFPTGSTFTCTDSSVTVTCPGSARNIRIIFAPCGFYTYNVATKFDFPFLRVCYDGTKVTCANSYSPSREIPVLVADAYALRRMAKYRKRGCLFLAADQKTLDALIDEADAENMPRSASVPDVIGSANECIAKFAFVPAAGPRCREIYLQFPAMGFRGTVSGALWNIPRELTNLIVEYCTAFADVPMVVSGLARDGEVMISRRYTRGRHTPQLFSAHSADSVISAVLDLQSFLGAFWGIDAWECDFVVHDGTVDAFTIDYVSVSNKSNLFVVATPWNGHGGMEAKIRHAKRAGLSAF